ncbi:hypothetical protein O181_069605 [Austropuccinia psidii MF-1]|uniref:Uncharacterized protein n=1 Tax=Austropuccinia psidii MF-1 TaxID=1389203 RepID=A0A9Q3EUT7_9BASI|nr:hypothetical protein [Austropuccinia psidii MF-1]
MPNIVFKHFDKLIMIANPLSVDRAVIEARHLFRLSKKDEVDFYVNLPQVGLAELMPSAWKHLEYGSVIFVISTPTASPKSTPDFKDHPAAFSNEKMISSNEAIPSPIPKLSEEAYSQVSANKFVTESQTFPKGILSRSSSSSSQSTAVDPLQSATIDDKSTSPSRIIKEEPKKAEPDPLRTVKILLEYPNRHEALTLFPESVTLNVEQKFHVLLGNLAKETTVSIERIELCLIRGSKTFKISPLSSPAALRLKETERFRIRLRSSILDPMSIPENYFPNRKGSSMWSESFKGGFPRGSQLLKAPKRGLGLPQSPDVNIRTSCALGASTNGRGGSQVGEFS